MEEQNVVALVDYKAEELEARMARIRELEEEVDKLKRVNHQMKEALNRRVGQSVEQLKKTYKTIFRLAGDEYREFTDDQELVFSLFDTMLRRIEVDKVWGKDAKPNPYTSWDYLF